MDQPTDAEIEAMKLVVSDKYADTMARVQVLVKAVLEEYPRHERVLACMAIIGVASGVMSVGLGLSDEESETFNKEWMPLFLKWTALGIDRNPELFQGGLPEPMKRGDGS